MLALDIADHLRWEPEQKAHWLLSWSGGADSTALVRAALELREKSPRLRLTALHIHFNLRGEASDQDAEFVKACARQWALPLMMVKADWDPTHVSQEQTRQFRLALSRKILPEAQWMEAHHRDDQDETFFFRLLRSTGLQGLSGMTSPTLRAGRRLWRPFLHRRKAELLSYLKAQHQDFREDQTNFQPVYQRNWLRRELFPIIETEFPQFREASARLREQIQDENEYFDKKVKDLFLRARKSPRDDVFDPECLRAEPDVILARFFVWLFAEKFDVRLSREKVKEIISALRSGRRFRWNAPRSLALELQSELLILPQRRREALSLPSKSGFDTKPPY